jgi:hypothetical protein
MPDHYMDDIFIDINRKKQLEDAQKNKEFDDAVAGGTLEDLRKGVDIKKKQQLLGTQLLDNIEYGVTGSVNWLKKQAEEDPDRYTDDMLRLLGGGVKNVGWALSKVPFLDKIAQGEDWLAEQARAMSAQLTPQLDPRFAGWGTRVATGLIADKGIGKAYKVSKPLLKKSLLANINRTARPVFAMSDDVPKVTNLPPKGMSVRNDQLFKNLGFEDWEKFFVAAWDDLADPISRNFNAAVANDKYSWNTFDRVRRETLPLVMEEYAGIADIKWPRKGPELHHINAIKATMPLFEGLARNERKELLKVLMREGIYAGHDPNNLMQLPHAVHKSVTKLWNDRIGKSGQLFFERDTDGLFKAAQLPFEERKLLAKNYAQAVKELELTTLKMLTDYKVISKDGLARKLDKELKKQFNIANFENYILTGKYLGDEVSPEVKEIFKSRSVKNIRKRVVPKKKIDE